MKNSIPFLILTFVFLILSVTSVDAQRDPARRFKTKIKEAVPNFSYTTLDGKEFNISDHKGKVVWINFFATWCGPCVKEIPHLTSLIKEVEGEDAVVLFVGRKHTDEELIPFSKRMRMDESMVTADPDRSIYFLFAEKYIPRSIIIDKEGNIVQQATGFDLGYFERMIKQYKTLAKKEVEAPIEEKKEKTQKLK